MQSPNFDETAAPTTSVQEPAELNERALSQVAGGLLPAVGPAAKAPASGDQGLIGLLRPTREG